MCNISLDRIINLQNKLVPEMVDLITERYKVLRQISHDQPIGRRTLAKKLGSASGSSVPMWISSRKRGCWISPSPA